MGNQSPQKVLLFVLLFICASGVNAQQVSAGSGHTCALLADGNIWGWGNNAVGQLGIGTSFGTHSSSETPLGPVDLGAGRTAKHVSAGSRTLSSHTCTVLDDDSLKCWGFNYEGQLGVGDSTDRSVPTAVDLGAGRTAKSVSAGEWHTCAVLDDDSLKCWGTNNKGQLGVGDAIDRFSPTAVDLGTGRTAKSVSAGSSHTCAVLDDDSLKCWGYNGEFQLGVGDRTQRYTPTAVDLGAGRTAKSVLSWKQNFKQSHVRGAG